MNALNNNRFFVMADMATKEFFVELVKESECDDKLKALSKSDTMFSEGDFDSFDKADTEAIRLSNTKNNGFTYNTDRNTRVLHTLHCGSLSYDVTPEAKKAIEGLMYWTHCIKLDESELASYVGELSKEENAALTELNANLKDEKASVKDMMDECEKQGVPNWVGNGAMQFARDNDLRGHYMNEFFEKSQYAEKSTKKHKETER